MPTRALLHCTLATATTNEPGTTKENKQLNKNSKSTHNDNNNKLGKNSKNAGAITIVRPCNFKGG